MAVCCLAVSPLLIFGSMLEMQMQQGLTNDTNEQMKEANLLCADSINNFQTVQSFGHEDMFVEKYRSIVFPIVAANKFTQLKAGFVFGLS